MTTARLLSVEQQPDASELLKRLTSIQKNLLIVDDAFLLKHASAFAGREYVKHMDLVSLLQTGEELRQRLSSVKNGNSYAVLKIEVEGFAVGIRNKIHEYKDDLKLRVTEAAQAMGAHHKMLLQRVRELRQQKRADAVLFPNLVLPYDELINAYNSDLENMQEQREQFHHSMGQNDTDVNPGLLDVLAKLFYINHFEKSFLTQSDDKYLLLERALREVYQNKLKSSIEKFHATLAKRQVIHANFVPHFDRANVIILSAMLKVLQDILRNVLRDTSESLSDLRENLQLVKKLENDMNVYCIHFYKSERTRRLKSVGYNKILAMSELIEVEMVKSAKQKDRLIILAALQQPLKQSADFYIEGRSYTGITTDHTPEQIDERIEKQTRENTIKALTTSIQENRLDDVNLINWASQFLQKVHAVTSKKANDVAASSGESSADEALPSFSFAKELKEKELDALVAQLAKSLSSKPSQAYSFLSLWTTKSPTVDACRLLVKMQELIADKSAANLQSIILLASQPSMPVYLRDDLEQIARTARDVLDALSMAVQSSQPTKGRLSQSML